MNTSRRITLVATSLSTMFPFCFVFSRLFIAPFPSPTFFVTPSKTFQKSMALPRTAGHCTEKDCEHFDQLTESPQLLVPWFRFERSGSGSETVCSWDWGETPHKTSKSAYFLFFLGEKRKVLGFVGWRPDFSAVETLWRLVSLNQKKKERECQIFC